MKKNLLFILVILVLFISKLNAQDKELWGMTHNGGDNGTGVIFKTDINGENQVVLYSFSHIPSNGDGFNPRGSLVQANNGKLYGMTSNGGSTVKGVLFEFDPVSNSYTRKIDFIGANGRIPFGSLMQANNGRLYGMTFGGGSSSRGTLFEYDPVTNSLSKKVDFIGTSTGENPYGALIQANNGKLYGMTQSSGANGFGVLFEYDPATELFSKKIDFNGSVNGRNPYGSLIQASNGMLYGMTAAGGINSDGTLFEYDPATEILTKKLDFDDIATGHSPYGSLMQANNSKLYGMTVSGGINSDGTLFEYDPATDTFIKKLDFDNIAKGRGPQGSLMQTSIGKLFGMTDHGGINDKGVLFEYNINSNTFTKKLDFDGDNGHSPLYIHLIEVAYDTYTWSGGTDGNWYDSDNWNDGNSPRGTNNVIIPSGLATYPILTGASYCDDLSLDSDASLIGQENLSVGGDLVIKREITGYSGSSDGWHFISSPVSSQTIVGSDFEPTDGIDDLYSWGETSGEWQNYYGGSFSDTEFEVGKGYLVAYGSTTIKEFNGNFNTASYTKNLTYTAGEWEGWNLFGNPYPSAIDWDLITKSGGIYGSVAIVNPIDGSYKFWNGSTGDFTGGEIPVNQGFFVKANSAGQTITMKLSDQVHSVNDYYKSTLGAPQNTLTINLKGEHSNNKTYIQFRDEATPNFDYKVDAQKLFGFAEIAQIYTELNDEKYAINCLNYKEEDVHIQLGIYLIHDEDLQFDFEGIDSFSQDIRIELEDKTTEMFINIREQNNYSFRGSVNNESDRFLLHISKVTGVEDLESKVAQAYAVDGRVYIRLEEQSSFNNITIVDLSGRVVYEHSLNMQNLQSFDLSHLEGIYLVQLNSLSDRITAKVKL